MQDFRAPPVIGGEAREQAVEPRRGGGFALDPEFRAGRGEIEIDAGFRRRLQRERGVDRGERGRVKFLRDHFPREIELPFRRGVFRGEIFEVPLREFGPAFHDRERDELLDPRAFARGQRFLRDRLIERIQRARFACLLQMLEVQEAQIRVVGKTRDGARGEASGFRVVGRFEQSDQNDDRASVRRILRDVLAISIDEFLCAPRVAVEFEQALQRRRECGVVVKRGAQRGGRGFHIGGFGGRVVVLGGAVKRECDQGKKRAEAEFRGARSSRALVEASRLNGLSSM